MRPKDCSVGRSSTAYSVRAVLTNCCGTSSRCNGQGIYDDLVRVYRRNIQANRRSSHRQRKRYRGTRISGCRRVDRRSKRTRDGALAVVGPNRGSVVNRNSRNRHRRVYTARSSAGRNRSHRQLVHQNANYVGRLQRFTIYPIQGRNGEAAVIRRRLKYARLVARAHGASNGCPGLTVVR